MAKSGRRGRPSRPYRASWGKDIHGLYKCPDGRWRINVTGQKFTEHDERRAVAKFLAMQEPDTVDVPFSFHAHAPDPDAAPATVITDDTSPEARALYNSCSGHHR